MRRTHNLSREENAHPAGLAQAWAPTPHRVGVSVGVNWPNEAFFEPFR